MDSFRIVCPTVTNQLARSAAEHRAETIARNELRSQATATISAIDRALARPRAAVHRWPPEWTRARELPAIEGICPVCHADSYHPEVSCWSCGFRNWAPEARSAGTPHLEYSSPAGTRIIAVRR